MCTPNLKYAAIAISEKWMKFQNLKVAQCDLGYVSFVLLIFRYLQSIYMINLNPMALAAREIFKGVRKFKSRSHKAGYVLFDLVFACRQNYCS